jgi:hypothetical protein
LHAHGRGTSIHELFCNNCLPRALLQNRFEIPKVFWEKHVHAANQLALECFEEGPALGFAA